MKAKDLVYEASLSRVWHAGKNQTFVFEGTWLDSGFIGHLRKNGE